MSILTKLNILHKNRNEKGLETAHFYDPKLSQGFYESRYEHGYTNVWSLDKKRKIIEVIQYLQLPSTGEALDFGCGNGVLTDLVRQALPSWRLYGTDISNIAVSNAVKNYPDCVFFERNTIEYENKKFDLIFTNHVFEHVYNLHEIIAQIDSYLKPESYMLHILPCGNSGSYENTICLLRKDGINKALENRYFYEDEGHVRRLTTDDFCKLISGIDFELKKEFYSNQYYGAINWITSSNPRFILMFSNATQAVDKDAKRRLHFHRVHLLFIAALRLPAQIIRKLLIKKDKRPYHYILFFIGLLFYPFSIPFDAYWRRKARQEWKTKKSERNGSEMYLFFKRSKSKNVQ